MALWWGNGDILQQGLSHTQVCCTQSPWGRPLLTRTSTGDTQTQFWLGLCGSGLRFVPFPGLQLGRAGAWQVYCPGGPCVSVTSLVPAAQLPRYAARAPPQVGHMSQSPPLSRPLSSPGTPREHRLRWAVSQSPPWSRPLSFPGTLRELRLRCAACLLWRADGRL